MSETTEHLDVDSLERIVPEAMPASDPVSQESLNLHMERYHFARKHIQPGRVLDIACGVGYGSYEIASVIDGVSVTGVDCSTAAVSYAKEHYAHPNVSFEVHDAYTFGLDLSREDKFDTAVSLETIEHLPSPKEFLQHLHFLLKPGGMLIASVPVTPSTDGNPHHLHDFTEASFRRLVKNAGFEEVDCFIQIQPFRKEGIQSEGRLKDLKMNLFRFYLKNPTFLFRRVYSLVTDGFNNRYLTLVARKVSL